MLAVAERLQASRSLVTPVIDGVLLHSAMYLENKDGALTVLPVEPAGAAAVSINRGPRRRRSATHADKRTVAYYTNTHLIETRWQNVPVLVPGCSHAAAPAAHC